MATSENPGTHPSHQSELAALKRVEGQIRGIQKMIEDGRYCIDILTQISAVAGALRRVEEGILGRHLNHCVTDCLCQQDEVDKKQKIAEVMDIINRFRKE